MCSSRFAPAPTSKDFWKVDFPNTEDDPYQEHLRGGERPRVQPSPAVYADVFVKPHCTMLTNTEETQAAVSAIQALLYHKYVLLLLFLKYFTIEFADCEQLRNSGEADMDTCPS